MCVGVCVNAGAHRGQDRTLDALELELQAVSFQKQMLGTELCKSSMCSIFSFPSINTFPNTY